MKGTGPAPVPGSADADAGLRRPVGRRDRARSTTRTPTCRSARRRGPTCRPARSASRGAAAKTIAPSVSDQAGAAFDPIGGGGACATAPGADQTGTASYRLDPAPAGGFTLMGSPTVVADINSPSPTSQIAARLLDVGPERHRDARRPRALPAARSTPASATTRQVFQLHPNGWKFESGHIAKLELLPADQPYGRNSNGQAHGDGLEPGAAPAGARAARHAGGIVLRPRVEGRPAPATSCRRTTSAAGIPAAEVGATPFRVSLVPAFAQCTGGNRAARPAAGLQLVQPAAAGLRPADGRHAEPHLARRPTRSGPVEVVEPATPANEADVRVTMSMTDVRNKSDLSDYSGPAAGQPARADHRPPRRAVDVGDDCRTRRSRSRPRARRPRAPRSAARARCPRPTTRSFPARSSRASGRSGSSARSRSSTAARTASRRRGRTRSSRARASSFRDLGGR